MTEVSLAALTDVHGNSLALEAVLADVRSHSPDLLVNLGDQIWGQVDPLAAYELQAGMGAVEVRGNNDEKPLMDLEALPEMEGAYSRWLARRAPREALERLANLPLTASLVDGTVLAAHGTPSSPWRDLLWRVHNGALVPRPDADVQAELMGLEPAVEVVLVGHTHSERVMRLDGRLLVNVGPVAWQNDGDPRARWALLRRRAGRWTVETRRVEYDWHAAARAVTANQPVYPAEAGAHVEGADQRATRKRA